MTVVTSQTACQARELLARRGRDVTVVAVMALAILAVGDGGSAAVETAAGEKSATATPAPSDGATVGPIILAGRWTGPRYGHGRVGAKSQDGGGKASTLTYDIVACGDGWCGIAVSDEKPCGEIGLRIAPDTAANRHNAFKGKLELAKDTAAYVVEAWYAAADANGQGGRTAPRLSLIGDTGTELMMFRRSYPLQVELTRISDAQCTLEQATS